MNLCTDTDTLPDGDGTAEEELTSYGRFLTFDLELMITKYELLHSTEYD